MFLFFDASFSQITLQDVVDKEGTVIVYHAHFLVEGQKLLIEDTLFVRNSLVLEPIKTTWMNDLSYVGYDGQVKGSGNQASGQKIKSYYLTDVLKMVGMGFPTDKKVMPRNIERFTSKTKPFGYGLSTEPFFYEKGYGIEDYSIIKDTVINSQKHILIKASKILPITIHDQPDKVLSTTMLINLEIKRHSYPFISEKINRRFGGAIVSVNAKYKSGLSASFNFEYIEGFTAEQNKLFKKYLTLYDSNISLLDRFKK